MNAKELFREWLAARGRNRRDPLTPAAALPYEAIWTSWCRWLTDPTTKPRARNYLQAKPEHVVAFISNRGLSEVSRRRYWRVLQRVYEYARAQQLLSENPADVEPAHTPPPENTEGLILNMAVWRKLPAYLPAGLDREQRRDRAILLLFMDLALTPQEVRELRKDRVGPDLYEPDRLRIYIEGRRRGKNQTRDLLASPATTGALLAWAKHRKTIAPKGAAKDLLFVSKRETAMSHRTLFHLASRCITAASEGTGFGPPEHHRGPMVLRNTRVVQWLNSGQDPEEVIRLAGLDNLRTLDRLKKHLNAQLQTRLWPRSPLDGEKDSRTLN
jgi:integrase/recombinase XerC